MSLERELPPSADRNLLIAVTILQDVFRHPSFSREFVPPNGWENAIEIQAPEIFDEGLVISIKNDKHPFTWEENLRLIPDFENLIKRQAETIRARVVWDDPQNPHIVFRASQMFREASASDKLLTLSHELGHFSAPVREDPFTDEQIEAMDLKNQLQDVLDRGYSGDLSELRLRRQGCTIFITLERRRFQMLGHFGKYYGNFFDELYADIYKAFLLAHLPVVKTGIAFEDAVKILRTNVGAGADSPYFVKLMAYADRIGWSKLVSAGISSNIDAFLDAGIELIGSDENKNLLDELQSLRSRFSWTDSF